MRAVLDNREAQKDDADRSKALAALNVLLAREAENLVQVSSLLTSTRKYCLMYKN
jgi:hypothetical protein